MKVCNLFIITVPFFTGMAARDVAQALRSLASAARGVAATAEDPQACNAMLDCAGDVLDKSGNLIEETKRAIAKPGDPDSQQRLAQVRQHVPDVILAESDTLSELVYIKQQNLPLIADV